MTIEDRMPNATAASRPRPSLWRRASQRMFANKTFARRGQTDHGSFDIYVTPGAQLSVLDPRGLPLDQVHLRFVDNWVSEDSIVWDIGGNMGLFAFPAALKARKGHVYTFEPDVELAAMLVRSTRRPHNANLKITVLPFALSNAEGIASFLIADQGRAMNKLDGVGTWHDDTYIAAEKRLVATIRVDKAIEILPPPSVIKIDVEGAEVMVLEGARQTIAKHRPVLIIEGPDQLADAFAAYFADLDYVFVDGFVEHPVPLERAVWNTVAVPAERWRAFKSRSGQAP